MDEIIPGRTDVSILFHLDTAGLTISDLKLGYIRWNEGDGTSFTEVLSGALTALATITTGHTDNRAIFLDTDVTGGNQFILRVDLPNAAFATGKDRVICNVFDNGNSVISERIFDLTLDLSGYVNGLVYFDSTASNTNTLLGLDGTINNPVSVIANAITLSNSVSKKISVKGTATISQALNKYTLIAGNSGKQFAGSPDTLNLNGAFTYENLFVKGLSVNSDGTSTIANSNVWLNTRQLGPSDLGGTYENSAFVSDLYDVNVDVVINGGVAFKESGNTVNFELANANTVLVINNLAANIAIIGLTLSNQAAFVSGSNIHTLFLSSSNTDGLIDISGIPETDDQTGAGCTVVLRHYTNKGFGTFDSNLIQIDGLDTNGNNATLKLKQLNVVNSAGDAIISRSTGGNGNGLNIQGHGTGHGIGTVGGATGHGVQFVGGATSGSGAKVLAQASGEIGMELQGGGSGKDISAKEIDDIKTKTDQMIFTISNELDVNMLSIIGTPISGGTNVASNFGLFYENLNSSTTKVVDDVGGSLSGIADAVWDALRTAHTDAGSFGEFVNSNLVRIEGSATIDTLAITKMFENIISHAQGDVVRVANTYTYKKQNGTTDTFVYTVSAAGRT